MAPSRSGVKVFTLRPFTVLKEGAPLRFPGRTHRKPLELLKVLIALGGKEVPEQQLGEALWPESEGDAAHSAFASTLHRLRKLIGRESLHLAGGRLSLAPRHCWVDAAAFVEEVASAAHAAEKDSAAASWELIRKALALYRRPFLDGEFEPAPILSARQRLHSLYLRHVGEWGRLLSRSGHHEQATTLYREALETDDLAEDLYRELMRCHLEQGHVAEGIAIYQRCREALKANVGIDPSPDTEAVYQELLARKAHHLPFPGKPSLAVMPFDDLSSNPDQEPFGDGLTEDIITDLSRFPDLTVTDRHAVFAYKGRSVSVRQIGKELGVSHVLEGSLQKTGAHVRANAQLIDTATGRHVWAERYDREITDLLAIQDQIRREIVQAVAAQLHAGAGAPESAPTIPRPAEAEGERRQATVLIVNVAGYDAIGRTLDPEEAEKTTSRIKAQAVRTVEGHGGSVNQFVRNEIVSVFGIPTAHEDDPVRAVRAALALREMARRIGVGADKRIAKALRLKCGIATGVLVIRPRDDREGLYGISGESVDYAAQLAGQAKADEILVTQETGRLISDFFTITPEAAKGKAPTSAAFRVLAMTPFRTRFEAAERRGYTPFVGRSLELATLHACLDQALAGQGQLVTVTGEAGIGKSRLVYEFRHSLDRERVTVLEGRCQSYGAVTPYRPLLDALRRGLRLRGEESPTELLDKAVANIRAIDPELEKYLPHYLHLLSIPSAAHPLPADLKGEALKRAFEEALAAILLLNTRHKPIVYILEDWHWADDASEEALKRIVGLIAEYPLLVIVLYRPEYSPRWGNPANHTPIVLKNLAPEHTESMIKFNWGASRFLPRELCALIHNRTTGNPFFVEELGSSLREERTVVIDDGQAVLSRSLESVRLPDTVNAVIQMRVDRLDPEAREALRLASVIGREFDGAVLERLYRGRKALPDVLERLKAQDLVHQSRLLPRPAYLFKHVLTQAAVYETLLLQRRKELHGRVGEAIEALHAERLEEHCEELAYHYSRSPDKEKAIHYLERAGDKSAQYFSLVEARHHYRRMIELLDSLEGTPEHKRKRIDINLKWIAISRYSLTGDQLTVLETSLNLARGLQDASRESYVTYWIGYIHLLRGKYNIGIPILEQCVQKAINRQDEENRSRTSMLIGRICLFTAEYSKGIELLKNGIPVMERLDNMDEVSHSLAIQGAIHGILGEFTAGFAVAERALNIARAIRNLTFESTALIYRSLIHIYLGQWYDPIVNCARAVTISGRIGDPYFEGLGVAVQGFATFMSGSREKGIVLMTEGISKMESSGTHAALTFPYAWLAESYALAGLAKDAKACAEKVFEIQRYGEKSSVPVAHRALALVAALEHPPDWRLIDAHMETSIRLSEDRGERPYLAVTCYRYAELLRNKNDPAQAAHYLDRAVALCREMGMTWWLERSAELAEAL